MAKKKKRKPTRNATAWCEHHKRLMNDVYIHRRGCAMRRCRYLKWLHPIMGAGESDGK